MSATFLQSLFGSIAERSRQWLQAVPVLRSPPSNDSTDPVGVLGGLARNLLSERGEASGVALARQVLDLYATLDDETCRRFFQLLATEFEPDAERVQAAATTYLAAPTSAHLRALARAVEPPRQELVRRLNLAPGGTRTLVKMRADLLSVGKNAQDLSGVDEDLTHLFYSWFNRGFLVLQKITWSTPASILERIIKYEAVHAIDGWDDLRRRLEPTDRRCYAFFHPSLLDDPLIFVEVALTNDIPQNIGALLSDNRDMVDHREATTAVFYSISNCQLGLRGISFGNFLIKQVVEDLSADLPQIDTFVTLSPVPGFAAWLDRVRTEPSLAYMTAENIESLDKLAAIGWQHEVATVESLRPLLSELVLIYLVHAKSADNRPIDPVARFHLGNGAQLERINFLGDTSPRGLKTAAGFMVNYRYNKATIETNHEEFAHFGTVVTSKELARQLRSLSIASLVEPAHE
jgi:malonyl-CoA decarboxylase